MSGNFGFLTTVDYRHYLRNTKSERAQLNQLTREMAELSSRIEALQPIKQPTGIFWWVRPLLHRVTLGLSFKPEREMAAQPSLCRKWADLFLHKITFGVLCSSSSPVLQSLYQKKQRELNLYRQTLDQLGSQRVKKAVQPSD